MKNLRSIAILVVLITTSTTVLAQPVTVQKNMRAVAFTKVDRSQLWIKRFDTAAYVALKANPTSNSAFQKIANLAVLDQSADGLTYLLGGSFTVMSPWGSNVPVTWTGIIAIRADSLDDPNLLSHVHWLKTAARGTGHFRPVGVLDHNRKWFGAMVTACPGVDPGVRFYHGSIDSDWNWAGVRIDSATPTTSSPNIWHMSNISITPDGNNMVAVVCEQPGNPAGFNMWIYHWNIAGASGPQLYESKITNYTPLMPARGWYPDTLFAFTVRVKDNANAELGLTTQGSPDIQFYDFNYNTYATLNPTDAAITSIPSSTISQYGEYFFAGQNISTAAYNEDLTDAIQHGMAGDISFNSTGDTILFITHPANDVPNVALRDSLSEIYLYTNGQATSIYNDKGAQELQPVLVSVPGYETWYPGMSTDSASLTFRQTDTNHSSTPPKNLTIRDTSNVATTIIDSIKLASGREFSLNGLPSFPYTLAVKTGTPLSISVVFKPLDTIGGTMKRDTIVVFSSTSMNTVIRIPMTGTAHVQPPPPPPGSVQEVDPIVFGMRVQPNPFTSATQVHLTAPTSGAVGIVVHDALGRLVYSSDLRRLTAGTDAAFTFDAQSLALPAGVYYVTAIVGDREASRQIVFAR